MNRIDTVFAQPKKLLNIFVTAGYPNLTSLPQLAEELLNSGVDILEIGMPYSDPLADGPVIQSTSSHALSNGVTMEIIFDQILEIRSLNKDVPIFLMGYLNQLLQVGVEAFLEKCSRAGVDGLIIPDLPVEIYLNQYKTIFETHKIALSFLVTPRTEESRIRVLDKACSSFIYVVSDNSLTGNKQSGFSQSQLNYFKRIRKLNLSSPTMIGFGISSKAMWLEACDYANGAIIGSSYLEAIRTNTQDKFLKEFTRK